MNEATTTTLVMPDLTWPRHGFYHTADSALMNLMPLGSRADRIPIRKAGRGWQPLRVVERLSVQSVQSMAKVIRG